MRKVDIELYGLKYTLYENGDIYNSQTGNKLKVRPNPDGYAQVTVGKHTDRRSIAVHRLVGLYFVDNPDGLEELDHLDCDRMNPAASNLEWVSHVENVKRIGKRGIKRDIHGSDNPNAKLTPEIVLKIRKEVAEGARQSDVGKKYGVPWSTVHNIVIRNTWKFQY